jgi:RNA polymerase primary sigma factor
LEAPNPLEQLQDSNLLDELGEVLEELDPRERKIISSRFGLGGDPPRTLEEVGKRFGVTRERIRQLQNGALAKLKRALARRDRPIEALLPGDIGVLLASRRKEDARCSRPDG